MSSSVADRRLEKSVLSDREPAPCGIGPEAGGERSVIRDSTGTTMVPSRSLVAALYLAAGLLVLAGPLQSIVTLGL